MFGAFLEERKLQRVLTAERVRTHTILSLSSLRRIHQFSSSTSDSTDHFEAVWWLAVS